MTSARADRFVAACHRLSLDGRKPFRLDPFWEGVTRDVFGTVDDDGRRVYTRATITTGKKNGKSTTVSAWVAVLLSSVEGFPDQSIVTIAGSLDQAGTIYKQTKKILQRSAFPEGTFRFSDQYRRITVMTGPSKGAEFRSLAAKVETAHGVIPTVVIVDEAVFVDPDLWQAVEESLSSAPEPLTISISHADVYNPESLYQKQLATARQIRDGVVQISWWYVSLNQLEPDDDYTDERQWAKANPTLGRIKSIAAMRKSYEEARRIPSKLTRWRQWHCATFLQDVKAWIAVADWERCSTILDREAFAERLDGRPCVVGMDLASTQDLTAIVAMFPPETDEAGPQILTLFFCPQGTIDARSSVDGVDYRAWAEAGWIVPTPGKATDYAYVEAALIGWSDRYRVEIVGYDAKFSHLLVQRLTAAGIDCAPVAQSHVGLSEPTKAIERKLLDGRVAHDGSPIMRWNVANAVVKRDENDNVRLSKSQSTGRIDGLAALVNAQFCLDRRPETPEITSASDLIVFV